MKGRAKRAAAILVALLLAMLLCTPAFAAGNTSDKDVDTSVSSYAREKYTQKKGGGRDKVTIMIYMIGSDLESQNGMATADLNEMLYAAPDNGNINMFIQTGGCKRWRNSIMTAGKLERWKLDSSLTLLERMKGQSMTDPNTLASFIQFCAKEAPADRYILIFWDHGGGSVTGYGYDERYPNDTMDIGEIGKALKNGGVKFDLVGFDACLMGTLETAIAVEPYADYMLASEESEPGTGWYYTRWLQMLDNNTSTNTLAIGKQIVDDYTKASASMGYQVATTLSLVDLAELNGTVLKYLGTFGQELTQQLKGKDYQSVATARNGTREFAKSKRLDQADLVDFCNRLGTKEASLLAAAIQDAVKYNRVNNISNAYGLSIYFPNSSLKSINHMMNLYETIGIDPSWSEGVRTYATLESSGQIVANSGSSYGSSSGSLIDILLGGSSGSSYDSSPYQSQTYESYDSMGVEDIYDILSGGSSYSSGYDTYGSGYDTGYDTGYDSGYGDSYGSSSGGGFGDILSSLFGGYTTTSGDTYGGVDYSSMMGGYGGSYESSYDYGSYDTASDSLLGLAAQMLFGRAPVGSETLRLTEKDGEDVLVLSEDKWEQVTAADLNVFVDDGTGFLDLGLDNVAEYNEEGDLIDAWDGTWLTLQGQPCALYPIDDEDEDGNGLYITHKFIPALLNGERVNLIIEFNEETGEDRVLGAQSSSPTGTLGKGFKEMNGGDIITLVCDFYDYQGNFQAQYTLGDPIIVPEDCVLTIANKELTGSEDMRMLYTYRLTDLYQAHYWLPIKEK
ncbi:MAG: peptidase C11 [Parasporobacterium sp.]|nr:peptidase C11 [Parasporobacterium sp.]